MWSIRDIKKKGRSALKGNYWRSVVVAALMSLLANAASALSKARSNNILQNVGFEPLHQMAPNELLIIAGIAVVGYMSIIVAAVLVKIIFANALEVGGCLFFRNNAEKGAAKIALIREGFSDYAHVFVTLLLRDVFMVLWFCLGIFPGLIKIYSYKMVPYIVKEYPDLSEIEVITLSRRMMDGNKWRAFLLDLTFLGWFLAGTVTFGIISVLWTFPYYENTMAALYLELRGEQEDCPVDPHVIQIVNQGREESSEK